MRQILTRSDRAASFVAQFGQCRTHRREAKDVHRALELLAKRSLVYLDPEAAVGDLVACPWTFESDRSRRGRAGEVLDTIAAQVVAEIQSKAVITRALRDYRAERIFKALLGAAARTCTWDAETIAVRSVRSVVHERVRHLGGCECGLG